MTKEIFLELNKGLSGSLSQERYLKNNYPIFFKDIMDYTKGISVEFFKERIYRYLNKDLENKICVCGNPRKLLSISLGYQEFCNRLCANKHTGDRIKKIKEERYGDANYNNPAKSRISHINNLAINGDKILAKRNKTRLEKYGDPNYTNRDKSKKTKNDNLINRLNDLLLNTQVVVINTHSHYQYNIFCKICLKEQPITHASFKWRINNNLNVCPNCYSYNGGISSGRKEINSFIESLGIKTITGDRSILKGEEIDILLPDHKIGIEFNGLFWHSEINKDEGYHKNKTLLAEANGYKLIHIWEDDWLFKKDIVKSKIIKILGLVKNIRCDECDIKEIEFQEAKYFIENNHLQEFCPAQINIGLVFNNELVSLMNFSPRKIAGSKEIEILRFCNKNNLNIIGGFQKIINYYILKYNPIKIINLTDSSWPIEEDLYLKSNFHLIERTKEDYSYIIENRRNHKFKYRKDQLIKQGFDPNLTEREIMLQRGIYRIYDCGNYKYEWNASKLTDK